MKCLFYDVLYDGVLTKQSIYVIKILLSIQFKHVQFMQPCKISLLVFAALKFNLHLLVFVCRPLVIGFGVIGFLVYITFLLEGFQLWYFQTFLNAEIFNINAQI